VSVVTIAEIEDGIAKSKRQGSTQKAARLGEWLETLVHPYSPRILPFDLAAAPIAGTLSDRARGVGHPAGFADLAIGAIARQHNLTILTRNIKHYFPLGSQRMISSQSCQQSKAVLGRFVPVPEPDPVALLQRRMDKDHAQRMSARKTPSRHVKLPNPVISVTPWRPLLSSASAGPSRTAYSCHHGPVGKQVFRTGVIQPVALHEHYRTRFFASTMAMDFAARPWRVSSCFALATHSANSFWCE
jgi:predicted nucleic acid-binding protein